MDDMTITVNDGLGLALATFRQISDQTNNLVLAGFASAAEMLTAAILDAINTDTEEN